MAQTAALMEMVLEVAEPVQAPVLDPLLVILLIESLLLIRALSLFVISRCFLFELQLGLFLQSDLIVRQDSR